MMFGVGRNRTKLWASISYTGGFQEWLSRYQGAKTQEHEPHWLLCLNLCRHLQPAQLYLDFNISTLFNVVWFTCTPGNVIIPPCTLHEKVINFFGPPKYCFLLLFSRFETLYILLMANNVLYHIECLCPSVSAVTEQQTSNTCVSRKSDGMGM